MDNDFCNNYGYLEISGGISLRKFPLLTKRVRGRIETFSMSGARPIHLKPILTDTDSNRF